WREVFGLENMIVRVYEKQQLPDGIFSDFLGAMNTKLDDGYKILLKNRNPSINWDFIEIIRLCNKSCLRQNKFLPIHTLLIQIFEKMNIFDNNGKRLLLSPQQRRDLIEKFADSNEKVAREYLGRSDGRLFYSPPPDLNEP